MVEGTAPEWEWPGVSWGSPLGVATINVRKKKKKAARPAQAMCGASQAHSRATAGIHSHSRPGNQKKTTYNLLRKHCPQKCLKHATPPPSFAFSLMVQSRTKSYAQAGQTAHPNLGFSGFNGVSQSTAKNWPCHRCWNINNFSGWMGEFQEGIFLCCLYTRRVFRKLVCAVRSSSGTCKYTEFLGECPGI